MNNNSTSALFGLAGAALGFVAGQKSSEGKTQPNENLTMVYDLQSKVNEALLNSIQYEKVIADLKAKLAAPAVSQTTVDFLQLQLADVTALYNSLMTYARSKIPELPTSFEIVEAPVEGLHFNSKIPFDRSKADRNITLDGGVISIRGVDNYDVSVFCREAGLVTELRNKKNKLLSGKILNIDTSATGCQIFFGNNHRTWTGGDNSITQMAEPMLLIEFDKSVDFKTILSNIKIGVCSLEGGTLSGAYHVNGFASLYRSNILAVKLIGIHGLPVGSWPTLQQIHLQMSTLVGVQQLMVNSAIVVDSKQVHVNQHAISSTSLRTSNYLAGKYVPYSS